MSLQFGIYDFFAYAVPGGLYIFSFVYIYCLLNGIRFDFASFSSLSIVQVLLFAVPAYIITLVIDRIAVFWYRIFAPKDLAQIVFEKFKTGYPNLEFNFQGKDSMILINYLQKENSVPTSEIHRFNALHIMLKNASFNFVILSVVQIVLYVSKAFNWIYLLIGIGLLIAAIISARQAVRIKRWFYSAIFEAVIAKSLEPTDLLTKHDKPVASEKSDVSNKRPGKSKK